MKRILTKKDLVNSFFTKLKQKNISSKEAAESMYLAQSTLSMWKANEAIPDPQLPNVSNFLQDSEFSAQVSNYFFGLPTVIEDKTLNDDPLSIWVHLLNVEKKKSSLCDELEEVLDHSDFNFNERQIVISSVQMLRSESAIESHLSNLLIDKYNITDKELHPQISKFAKDKKRIVEREVNRMASN